MSRSAHGAEPGMSAKVEILVNKLADCVYVPVQAIAPDGDKQVCYIGHGLKPERREVEIGEFNDEFIEVKNGIKEGERVMLRTPDGIERDKGGKDQKSPEKKDQPGPPPSSSPVQWSAGRPVSGKVR